jgi:hypothetical protein
MITGDGANTVVAILVVECAGGWGTDTLVGGALTGIIPLPNGSPAPDYYGCPNRLMTDGIPMFPVSTCSKLDIVVRLVDPNTSGIPAGGDACTAACDTSRGTNAVDAGEEGLGDCIPNKSVLSVINGLC